MPKPRLTVSVSSWNLGVAFRLSFQPEAIMPSTLIRDIDYNETTKTLSVRLTTSGDRYVYEDVDPRTYEAFRSAFVKGRFFNRFIRGRYRYRLVAGDER
jgi:hypothetical protein